MCSTRFQVGLFPRLGHIPQKCPRSRSGELVLAPEDWDVGKVEASALYFSVIAFADWEFLLESESRLLCPGVMQNRASRQFRDRARTRALHCDTFYRRSGLTSQLS